MKYDVLFSCGHEETVSLFGPGKERERTISWYRSAGLCSECYAKRKQERYNERNQAHAEEAKSAGLPALTGTEKQIAWAETLRVELYKKWIKEAQIYKNPAETVKRLNAMTLAETSAKFWIDHRHDWVFAALDIYEKRRKKNEN